MTDFRAQAFNRAANRRQAMVGKTIAAIKKAAERDIQKVITDTCDSALIPYMRNYPNKIVTNAAGEKILAKIPEHQRGKPDLTVLCLKALTIWVETKAHDGKLSPDQLRWKDWIESRGHEYHAPRTIEEAHKVSERILQMGRK